MILTRQSSYQLVASLVIKPSGRKSINTLGNLIICNYSEYQKNE